MRQFHFQAPSAALLLLCGCAAATDGTSGGNNPVAPPGASSLTGTGGAAASIGGGAAGALGSGTVKAGTGGAVAPGGMIGAAAAGAIPPATGGTGAPKPTGTGGVPGGTGGTAAMGPTGTPAPMGAMDPVIPMVSGDCPMFVDGTITFMGLGGIQLVTGPKPASASAPMVFYWHGTGSTSGEFAFMAAQVQQGVVQEGGVLVSFQDTTGGDLLSGTAIFGAGDFKLTDQLLACAVRDHNVDPRRVFATGCSAGGLFSGAMAAERSSYIAAAASNSGGWTVPVMFDSMHTPPFMAVHGAAGSDVVVIDFSQSSMTLETAWGQRGGLSIDCDHGGGHCGGAGQAPAIWTFFEAHPFGVSPDPYAGGLPAGFDPVCKLISK
ncbi:MAG: hypothetical protein ACHQ53_03770 [Polyangiales bacterium]